MIVRIDPDYLEHASKSKYKGGFTKDGKNTSAYNHDYYIHNKEKWKDNEENTNNNPFEYEDKDVLTEVDYNQYNLGYGTPSYDVAYTYHNPKTGETHNEYGHTQSKDGLNTSRKRNGGKKQVVDAKAAESSYRRGGKNSYNAYKDSLEDGRRTEVKTAKVYKRGEGIGGGPSGTKDYSNRSTNTINKRKKGRKPVGKVVFSKN